MDRTFRYDRAQLDRFPLIVERRRMAAEYGSSDKADWEKLNGTLQWLTDDAQGEEKSAWNSSLRIAALNSVTVQTTSQVPQTSY